MIANIQLGPDWYQSGPNCSMDYGQERVEEDCY